jgi:AraC-like DNA-binding protein
MQRLLRFQAAARLLLKGGRPMPGLAAVALDCGYSDQAHLTREFRRFAAITPAAFVAGESGLAELFHDPGSVAPGLA